MKFTELGLHPSVLVGVEENGFEACTPIQAAAIPHILAGRDVAGLAQTGTGKTAAFVLPLVERIVRSREAASHSQLQAEAATPEAAVSATESPQPQTSEATSSEGDEAVRNAAEEHADDGDEYGAKPTIPYFKDWRRTNFILVLVPTRELADQVYENVAKFGKGANVTATSIYGGTGYEGQKAALKKGVDFIVATPGRLIDLYKEHLLDLNQVRAVVFDEADRMFDMGFKDDMKFILRRVPQDRQFLVFSATLNFDVLNTAYEFGANPVEVNVSRDAAKAENVVDEIFHVGQYDKPKFLLSVLQKYKPRQTIVFSNFKHNVDRIAKFLTQNGVPAMGISSLISQNQRTRIMELFRTENNDRNILVATDVAARGLDIKGVDMVINFELPDDAENYVHRIGRTGRAGEKGTAYSLVSDRDVEALQRIESYLGHKVTIAWIDDTELVSEFKPFPNEDRRPDFKRDGRRDEGRGPSHRQRGGGRGGRPNDQRGRPGDQRGRPEDQRGRPEDQRPSSGPGGRRHDSRPNENRPHDNRPRPEGRFGGRPNEQAPRRAEGGNGRGKDFRSGQRPQSGHRHEPRGAEGREPRGHEGRQQAGQGGRRHDRNDRSRNWRDQQRSKPQGYKHKPGATPTASPAARGTENRGVMSAVSGFFKKLFGG